MNVMGRKTSGKGMVQVTAVVPPDMREQIRDAAKADETSESTIIRRALRVYFAQQPGPVYDHAKEPRT